MNELSTCIKVAACICAKDGVISELEEQAIFRIVSERFPDLTNDNIEMSLIDSNHQIEDYLALIDDNDLRKFTLNLAEVSASADGLNLKENIALEKAYLVWGIKHYV
jgi:hypothetical protein